MKKLLFLLISVSLISCSGDDTAPVTGENPNYLVKLKQVIYDNGAIEEKIEFEFVNGKSDKVYFYTAGNELTYYTKFSYNDNGLVKSTTTYTPQHTEVDRTEYTYDNQLRINSKAIYEGQYSSVTNYIFNNDNTITASTTHNGMGGSVKTYYLNSNNIVYKEAGNSTYEVTFDGFNPISSQFSFGNAKTFIYDEINTPAVINVNITGDYKPNAVLRANSLMDAETSTATKYINKVISGTTVTENVRTFNADGLPVKVKVYRNGILRSESDYIY